MSNMPLRAVGDAFHQAWQLRWPFLLSHLVFSLVAAGILTPATTLSLRATLALSGQPALSDFDIAVFLLSPAGFVAAILVVSLLLTIFVLNLAFMMAIALDARRSGQRRFEPGVASILPKFSTIFGFSWRLLLRIFVIVAPFLLLALLIARARMTEYDINYYLTEHPPEFIQAVIFIGALLLAMAALLVWKLLGWAVALPLVLFEDTAPAESFAASVARMQGQRLDLFVALLAWGLVSAAVLFLVFAGLGLISNAIVGAIGPSLRRVAAVLLLLSGVWFVLNLLVTTVTTGALAGLLMERAGWPGMAETTPHVAAHRHILRGALIVAAAVAGIAAIAGGLDLGARRVADDIEIISHRGAAGARPENTLAAFEKAIEDKADWIELDVQENAEGEVIVVHDSDFMKLAGVDLKVWDSTAADLSDIDIGSWYSPDYAQERTPTLRQVLELAKGTQSGVLIELKYYGHDESLEDRVSDLVAETGMDDRVQAMSLKYDGVKKMKALRPDWNVGLLAAKSVGRLWELDADFLAVNMGMATPGLIRRAREAGKPLYVWTVNDPLAMSQMASLGVSGLITDEPALAREVLEQRKDLSSVQRLVLALGNRLGLTLSDNVYRDDSP